MTNFFIIWLIATKIAFWNPFLVEGESMDKTLHDHELILIDRQIQPETLQRGTIVVFSFDNSYYYIKRVIGLPGETLKIGKDGVEIKAEDGQYKPLNEPYLLGQKFNYGDTRYFIVPDGEYFMLGDNRDHSKDSRYFSYPYVKIKQIYGKYIYP